MNHNELHIIDLCIIGAYLIAMVSIGVRMVKRVKNTDDYYVAGRSFGPIVLMATVCATIIGGSGLMGRAGVAYSSGFKAVLTALPYLIGMLLFFLPIQATFLTPEEDQEFTELLLSSLTSKER